MISEETIKKIAHLARLELTPHEVTLYSKQLGAILDYVDELKKVDTTNVAPMVTPTDMTPTYRDDHVEPGLGAEGVTRNAPEKTGHLYKVPPVL